MAMADASICGLGQAAPNPIRCVVKYFPDIGESKLRGRPELTPPTARASMTAMTQGRTERDAGRVQAERQGRGRPRRRDHHPDRQAPRRRDPAPLLQGRPAARRQLPRLRGRGEGRARAGALVLPQAAPRAWKSSPTTTARRALAEDGARAAALRHAEGAPHARLPSSTTGRPSSRSASRASRRATSPRPISRTTASRSISIPASSARAACAPAARSR